MLPRSTAKGRLESRAPGGVQGGGLRLPGVPSPHLVAEGWALRSERIAKPYKLDETRRGERGAGEGRAEAEELNQEGLPEGRGQQPGPSGGYAAERAAVILLAAIDESEPCASLKRRLLQLPLPH